MTTLTSSNEYLREKVEKMNIDTPLQELFTHSNPEEDGKVYVPAADGQRAFLPGYKIANAISWPLSARSDEALIDDAIEAFEQGFINKIYEDQLSCLVAAAVPIEELPRCRTMNAFVIPREGAIPMRSIEVKSDFFDDEENERFNFIVTEAGNYNVMSSKNRRVIRIKGFTQDVNAALVKISKRPLPQGTTAVIACDFRPEDCAQGKYEALQVFDDPVLHRQMRQGIYGWCEIGLGVGAHPNNDLPNVLIGSMNE